MSEREEIPDIRNVPKRREEAHWRAYLDRRDSDQGRLPFYSYQSNEGDIHARIKRAAAQDLKECRWSREQVTEGLAKLIGRPVSVAQIDAVVAESHTHRLPAEWIPAWSRITQSTRVLEILCAEVGMWLADDVEHDLAELARAEMTKDKLAHRAAALRRLLSEKI